MLLFLDAGLLVGAFSVVYRLRLSSELLALYQGPGLWFSVLVTIVSLYVFGAYELTSDRKWSLVGRVLLAIVVASFLMMAWNYLLAKDRGGFYGRGIFIGGSFLFVLWSSLMRLAVGSIVLSRSNRVQWVFLVNHNDRMLIEADLKKQSFRGKIHFLDPAQVNQPELQINQDSGPLVVGFKDLRLISGLVQHLMKVKLAGQTIFDLASFYEINWQKIPFFYIDDEWVVTSGGFGIVYSRIRLRLKRVFDLMGATLLLVFTWPLMLLTAIAVCLESSGPILYRQTRTGLNRETFTIYKFRSMRVDAESSGAQWAQKNDSRVTRVGSFIRKTRLDEFPQLMNIFRGEMSFVGPRPERPEFNVMLEKEIPFYDLRHSVPPGLTGWAQVNYPYGSSIEDAKEKLSYELYYIKNHSLFLDFYILLKTIQTVLFGKGR